MTQNRWSHLRRLLMIATPALALVLPTTLAAQETAEQATEEQAGEQSEPTQSDATEAASDTAAEASQQESQTSKTDAPGSAREDSATESTQEEVQQEVQQQQEGSQQTDQAQQQAAQRVQTQQRARQARDEAQRDIQEAQQDARQQVQDAQQDAENAQRSSRGAADRTRRRGEDRQDAERRDDRSERDRADDRRDRREDRREREDMDRDNRAQDEDLRERRFSQDRESRTSLRGAARLGVSFGIEDDRLVINDIRQSSVLRRFGIRQGDVIVSVDGHPVRNQADFARYVFVEDVERVPVVVLRDGTEETIYVVTSEIYADGPSYSVGVEEDYSTSRAAYLGVALDERYQGGALVRSVQAGSPAEEAGIERGDVIIALNGRQISNSNQLLQEVRRMQPGDELDVEFSRRVYDSTVVVLGAQRGQTTRSTTVYEEEIRPERRYSEERVEAFDDRGVRVEQQYREVEPQRYNENLQFRTGGAIQQDDDGGVRGGVRGILRGGRRN